MSRLNGTPKAPPDTADIERVLDSYAQTMHALLMAQSCRGTPWLEGTITLPQLKALGMMVTRKEGMSGRELAAMLNVGPSAVTPLVDRLVEHGYVRREEDRSDRRITRLLVTDAGLAILQRMMAGRRELMAEVLRQFDADELGVVAESFRLLCRGVQSLIPEPLQPTG